MTHCPACRVDVHPFQEMGDDMRLHNKCGKCGCLLDAHAAPVAAAPKPALRVVAEPVKAAIATPAPTGDVLSIIRARLDVVRAEIRDVRALEAEAEMLQRMLDAAMPRALAAE